MTMFNNISLSKGQHVIPYRPEHLLEIDLRDYEKENYAGNIKDYLEYVDDNAWPDLTWTGVGAGKVVLIFGFRPMWKGCGEGWILPGYGLEKHAISLLRNGRFLLTSIMEDYELNRLQIAVSVRNETAYKFAKAMYFNEEVVMPKFGPEGSDYYLMSRLSEN
tara:strand:- start:305 stop:790 length:486 start_codon:yes stop_codon:yes gene_type:complete